MPGTADRRLLASAILALGVGLVGLPFWPGIVTLDARQTLLEASAKFATDWCTAFGALALRRWMEWHLGLGLAYAVGLAIVLAGAYLCLRLVLRRVPAAVAAVLLALFPPTYAVISAVSHTFYLGASLLAFGLLATAYRHSGRRTMLLAFWCRQNGLTVVFAVVAFAMTSGRVPARRRVLVAAAVAGASCVALLGLTKVAYQALDVRSVHAERFLYVYDLAQISNHENRDLFSARLLREREMGWVSWPVDMATSARAFAGRTSSRSIPTTSPARSPSTTSGSPRAKPRCCATRGSTRSAGIRSCGCAAACGWASAWPASCAPRPMRSSR